MNSKLKFIFRISILLFFVISLAYMPAYTQEKPITINIWRHHKDTEINALKDLIKRFEKLHPKIKVNLLSFPFSVFTTKLAIAIATNKGPDIINIHNSWARKYIKAGLIIPIPEKPAYHEKIKKDFFPMLKSFYYNEAYYGLPLGGSNLSLFYNKSLFKKAGLDPQHPPRTHKEFVSMAKKLTVHDKAGRILLSGAAIGMPNGQGWNYFIEGVLRQFGVSIISKDLKSVLWNSPQGIKALRWYTGFIKEHKIYSQTFPVADDAFKLGLSAMMISGSWSIGQLKKNAPNLNYAIAPLPASNKNIRATYGSFWGNALTSNVTDEVRPWAWEFIKFITTYENMKRWTKKTGEVPMRRQVLNDTDFKKKNPLLVTFINQLPYSHSSVKKDETLYKSAITEAMEQIIYNDMSPKKALEQAARTVNKMLRKEK